MLAPYLLAGEVSKGDSVSIRKLIKMIIGVLLLPLCIGSALALWRLLPSLGRAEAIWIPAGAGAALWTLVYLLFPRPMWVYVFGHELTHAVWTWFFGGRVGRIRVSSQGGHVATSKTNFLIALAPYFFPFYVVTVVLAFLLLRLIMPWDDLEPWFLGSLGIAYGFHLTLTAHILKTRQSDITEHGYLFSTAIIFLGNVAVLLIGIPLLAKSPTIPTALVWCWEETVALIQSIQSWVV
jgi:hypothetical protein